MKLALKIYVALIFIPLIWAISATANTDIRLQIHQGEYEQAYQAASNLETADGLALAAESLNAQILLGEIPKLNKAAKKARDYAQHALDLDPEHYNARLQYVLADGFVTRTSSDFKAWRKKLPQKTLRVVLEFDNDYPNDPRAKALLAAWHLGVIRKAGIKNGEKWFGASLEEGKRLYSKAKALAPDDILIAANCYVSLHVLNLGFDDEYKRKQLETILALPAKSHIDKAVKQRMQDMLDILGDRKAEKKLAERFLDGDWE